VIDYRHFREIYFLHIILDNIEMDLKEVEWGHGLDLYGSG
jgi:hypothetical protein